MYMKRSSFMNILTMRIVLFFLCQTCLHSISIVLPWACCQSHIFGLWSCLLNFYLLQSILVFIINILPFLTKQDSFYRDLFKRCEEREKEKLFSRKSIDFSRGEVDKQAVLEASKRDMWFKGKQVSLMAKIALLPFCWKINYWHWPMCMQILLHLHFLSEPSSPTILMHHL